MDRDGRPELRSLTAGTFDLEGVSTHISVSIDHNLAPRAAGMFSRTFAPALMLLMDAADSPGLLVRPRHRRLELGAEFVAGDQLAAAIALAVGGALVCVRAAASFLAKAALPPPVRVDVVRTVGRYGWYVARDAFGTDLYAAGRDSVLKRELVGTIRAQDCLEEAWKAARKAVENVAGALDLHAADDAVSGRSELPLESGLKSAPPDLMGAPTPTPLGQAMTEIETSVLTLSAAAATWDYAVFRVHGAREIYVSVPSVDVAGFLRDVRHGRYDERLRSFIEEPDRARTLATFDDACTFGLWDAIDFTPRLAAPERGGDGVERLAGS